MKFKKRNRKQTGVNFLCDALILPTYFSMLEDFHYKYPPFETIDFRDWNFFIAVFYFFAIQTPLSKLDDNEYKALMTPTLLSFEEQYPQFREGLRALISFTSPENNDAFEQGIWLSGNLLQKPEKLLTIDDIMMGCEIADRIKRLVKYIDPKELF